MFRRLRQLYKEFDEEVLGKEEKVEQPKTKPEVKEEYKKAEFDFKGHKYVFTNF